MIPLSRQRSILPVLGAALTLTAGVATAAPSESSKPLNVLFIVVDDLRNDIGCYGQSLVSTPSMDRLADRGVRFDRAYCQYPLCNPSRASVMTGRRPDTTGVNLNEEQNTRHFREKLPDVVTLPQLFRQHGYFSARVGKIYHYGVPREIGTESLLDDKPSWDAVFYPRGAEKDEEDDLISCTPDRHPGWALSWRASPSAAEDHTDGKVASDAIRLLEENRERPFFLAVGFYRPHVPCTAPAEFFDRVPLDSVHLPEEPPEHFAKIPDAAFIPIMQVPPGREECLRDFSRAYYACIDYVDTQIGRVLDAVERLGLGDRTMIVLWGDHGWMLGEHRQWTKPLLFEECARGPLMIYVPGARGNGRACDRVVEFVDIYPTVADMCGLPLPDGLEGTSLKPLLTATAASWDRPAYTQLGRRGVVGHSVRTDRWRYTEWNGGEYGRELYDQERDPKEYNNLADSLDHTETVAAMRALLDRQWPRGAPAQKAE